MALYQLPKAAVNSLRVYMKGAPSQPSTSILPAVIEQFLDRLSDPSPAHHILRAPFIRPLLNNKASERPVFGLLTTLYQPEPEHLEPDSPLQKQLIEFFEEKRDTLLLHTSIEEDLPIFVYCMHRKRLLGQPELIINDAYNTALNKANKHQSMIHAVSVLSHQFSLMLQARADPYFKVTASRRPSDIDITKDPNTARRAAYTDFLLEKRAAAWQIAGCLQPDNHSTTNNAPTNDIPYYQPRLLDQRIIAAWGLAWYKPYKPKVANLSFFTMENTVPWESVPDVVPRKIKKGGEEQVILVPARGNRKVAFVHAPTDAEMKPIKSTGRNATPEEEPEENRGNWERGPAVLRMHRRRASWIDQLSAADLEQVGEREQPQPTAGWNPRSRWNKPSNDSGRDHSSPRRRVSGANTQSVSRGSRQWGTPSTSPESSSGTTEQPWPSQDRQRSPSRSFGAPKFSEQRRRFGDSQ